MKWYFLFFVLLWGCQKEPDSNDFKVSVSLKQIEEAKVLPWGILFDSLEISPSLSVEKLPLWRIRRVIQAKDYWVILTAEELVVMSRDDTTSYIFRKIGRGPEEYTNLEDVVYDEKNRCLLVLTGYPNRIFTFNFPCNYISSYALPYQIMWERLFLDQEDLYIFGENYDEVSKVSYDVFCRYKDDSLSRIISIGSRIGRSSSYWSIVKQEQNILVGLTDRDSLFRIDADLQVTPQKLVFTHEQQISTEKVHDQQLLFANDKIILFQRTLPKGEWRRWTHHFIYDYQKKSSSVHLNLNAMAQYLGCDRENMYYQVNPAQVGNMRKTFAEYQEVYQPLFRRLDELDESANPLFLRFHIKQ